MEPRSSEEVKFDTVITNIIVIFIIILLSFIGSHWIPGVPMLADMCMKRC